MTTPTVPQHSPSPVAPEESPSRIWTSMAYLSLLAYLVWLPVMFVMGYWVTSWFDVDPGSGPTMADQGVLGWLANLGLAVLAGLPAWLGAGAAIRSRHLGGRTAPLVALVLTVLVALVFLVGGLADPL